VEYTCHNALSVTIWHDRTPGDQQTIPTRVPFSVPCASLIKRTQPVWIKCYTLGKPTNVSVHACLKGACILQHVEVQVCFPPMRSTFVRNALASVLLGMWVRVCWYCAVYKEVWALISFSDICVLTCYFICGFTLTIPAPHAHAPPLLPSGPTSSVFCSLGHKHWGGTSPSEREVTTPKIGAWQRQLSLSLRSPLPAHTHTGREGRAKE